MRLDDGRESSNVEDCRDQPGAGRGRGGMPLPGGRVGLGTIAICDDTLQRNAGRGVSPDSFTHGSSAQRVRWFRRGIEAGDMKQCDTFAARQL